MKNYLLFQAYGKSEVPNECKYALLKLHSFPFYKDICVVLYTDRPEFFKDVLSLFEEHEIFILTPDKIKEWSGEFEFVHRVKIEIIKHFFNTHSGNVLYCDTDTYFIQSPEMLFTAIDKGSFFMHILEGYIDRKTDPQFKKWERFLTGNTSVIPAARIYEVNNIQMWNAGVIGIRDDQKHLLDDVLELTDKVYKQFPKHITEQFAFSYVFQKNMLIQPASPYIFHYWNLKEFAGYLENIFSTFKGIPLQDQLEKITQTPEDLVKEKEHYKRKYKFIKFLVSKWKINIPK